MNDGEKLLNYGMKTWLKEEGRAGLKRCFRENRILIQKEK